LEEVELVINGAGQQMGKKKKGFLSDTKERNGSPTTRRQKKKECAKLLMWF